MESPECIARSRILAKFLNEAVGPCSSARSLARSLLTTRSVVGASPVRLPLMSPMQPLITWLLVTMWPLALMTKPVPVCVPVLPDLELPELGLLDVFGASGFAAVALGAVNSPALLIPPAFTVWTQLARTANRGAVEVRLKFRALALPVVTTIRLAF